MKASLRCKDGNVLDLNKGDTTIGREDADISLRYSNVELRHALIRFNEEEQCFVLQDLNSSHGCYVNDTRVQNAAVRLAHGDLIEFGYGNPIFEFHLSSDPVGPVYPTGPSSSYAWDRSSSLRYYNNASSAQGSSFLPYLPTSTFEEHEPAVNTTGPTSLPHGTPSIDNTNTWTAGTKPPISSSSFPRPPLRTRPASAGAQRPRPASATTSKSSAVSGVSRGSWTASHKQERENVSIEEMEQRLLRMGDELSRLACYESECHRKDRVISELRDEISELKKLQFDTRHLNLQGEITELHNNLRMKQEAERTASQKLAAFQSQLHQKNRELASLKQRLDDTEQSRNGGWMNEIHDDTSTNTIATLRTELDEKDKNIVKLKNELQKNSKQRSHLTSLMNTLQKENSSKETLLQHAKNDLEKLKKIVKDKEASLSNVNTKLTRQKAAKEAELDVEKTREELLSIKAKYQSCHKQLREKNDVVIELQKDIKKCTRDVEEALKGDKVSKMELDHAKAQFVDSQRELQLVKIDEKQLQKRFDQFSRAVFEATFSSGFGKVSRKELEDDEIVDYVQQLSEERKHLSEKLDEISDFEERKNAEKHSLKLAREDFQHCLKQIRTTLSWSGHQASTVRSAIEKLTEYEIDKDDVEWVKAACLSFLQDELSWFEKEQNSLLDAGFDQETVNKGLSNILSQLKKDLHLRQEECHKLQEKISSMEEVHEITITRLKEEMSSRENENLSIAIRETRAAESEKRLEIMRNFREKEKERIEVAIATEKRILESQHGSTEQLKKTLDERSEECENYKSTLESVRGECDEMRATFDKQKESDHELHKELEEKCSAYEQQMKDLEKELLDYRTSKDNEVASYKEQAHQHALTIVAMEERLIKLSKQTKSYEQEQITKQQLALLTPKKSRPLSPRKSSRPSSPTKARPSSAILKEERSPKVTTVGVQTVSESNAEDLSRAEIFKLEQLVLILRREAADAKRESTEHSDVVLGLKRDLAGAWARLSDVTGELSDQQKQKVEEYKEKIEIQDRELHDQREQLKKLSALVDFQKAGLERTKTERGDGDGDQEICGEKKALVVSSRQKRLKSGVESEAMKQLATLSEETLDDIRATAERCHGEKHVQIITKQKEALREMRQRVKKMDQFKPPLLSQEEALKQVTILRNELSEQRAREAEREDDFNRNATELQLELKRNRQVLCENATEMSIEKSSHEETKSALDKSEQTYLNLVRSVAALLKLESLPGCRSMAHIPTEERNRLEQERQKNLEVIEGRLQKLLIHLNSKKELLKDYNTDLEKLREVESLAGRKSAEIESLATDLETQNRETNCLRVSLNRTREELDREKRLNTSLKEKKKFSMDAKESDLPKHSCYVDEQKKFKEEMKRKKMVSKLKRKNYEIESLKQELCAADTELNNTAAELQALDPSRNFQLSSKTATILPETDSQARYITIF